MIKPVKILLYKLLGLPTYLKLLHVSFFMLYDTGILKRNYIYKYHYYVKNFNSDIEQGDYIFIHKSMKTDPSSGKILSPDRLTRQEVHRKLVEESVM